MNVQSCFMSTFISINIARLFRLANPQNAKIRISIKLCKKKEKKCVYLPNTSHFMHFQSVRQKKGNIHNKTNKQIQRIVVPRSATNLTLKKVKGHRQGQDMVPPERSCHKEHTCQVSKLYL